MGLMLIRPNDMKAVYGDTYKYAACEPPYWAGVIASYARERDVSVEILDAEALDCSPEDVANRVMERKPSLVGVCVTGNNLSASTQKMNGAGLVCQAIKRKEGHIPIFIWGLHPSALPERTMKEENIDFLIKGEGLKEVVQLFEYVKNGTGNLEDIKGLYYRDNGKAVGNSQLNLEEIGNIPAPAWDLMPMERYLPHNWHLLGEDSRAARGKYAVLATSLGCPYNCSFCAIASQFGSRKVRFFDIDHIMEEIDVLVNQYHIKYLKILDECFVLNEKYVSEFCDRLIEKDYGLNIWGYARIDTVNKELLEKLRKAGIRWLAFGIESGSKKSMDGVSKGQYDNEKVKRVVEMVKNAGIYVLANFMFGLPDDDLEDMQATYGLCREINPEWINFYVTMAYPGSKTYAEYMKNGEILPDNWMAYAQYSYECTPKGSEHLSPAQVLEYRDWAFHAFFENNERYFGNIEQKFGRQAVVSIQESTKGRLRRKLLEDPRSRI